MLDDLCGLLRVVQPGKLTVVHFMSANNFSLILSSFRMVI